VVNWSTSYWVAMTVLKAMSLSYFLLFLFAMKTTLSAVRIILLHFLSDNSNSNYHPLIFTCLSWINQIFTFLVRKYFSERLQKELFDFERFFIWINDLQVSFVIQFKYQWSAWIWQISCFWFQKQMKLVHHWVNGKFFRHFLCGMKRVKFNFNKIGLCLNLLISNF